MPDLLIKADPALQGYKQIVAPGEGGLEHLSFGLATLEAGEDWEFDTAGAEWCIVILSGSVRVWCGKDEMTDEPLGGRKKVFDGPASAIYLPPKSKGRVEAAGPARLAVCKATSESGGDPIVILPEMVGVKTVGVHNWQRQVHDIVDRRIAAGKLLVGETFNRTGCWSSYPPHRHDEHRPPEEANLEEVYFFQVDPPQGFGIQRIYTDDRDLDECYAVEHGDTAILPRGYHPVAAAPGYRVYYLWLMAGTGRTMAPYDDPAHHWVAGAETLLEEMEWGE
jgi:5-deoxy-glucuronate isomerase